MIFFFISIILACFTNVTISAYASLALYIIVWASVLLLITAVVRVMFSKKEKNNDTAVRTRV